MNKYISYVNEGHVGKQFEVSIDDCCVNGYFVATLVAVDGEDYGQEVKFDNGVTLELQGGVTLVEVDSK